MHRGNAEHRCRPQVVQSWGVTGERDRLSSGLHNTGNVLNAAGRLAFKLFILLCEFQLSQKPIKPQNLGG